MSNPLPSEYLPLYEDRLKLYGELVVTGSVAREILRGYRKYICYRTTLEQMAAGQGGNVDMSAWARRVISDDQPVLVTVRTRKPAAPKP